MFDSHAHIGSKTDKAYVSAEKPSLYPLLSPFSFSSVGLLPPYTPDFDLMEEYASKGYGIGEIGLDRRFKDKPKQIDIFYSSLLIAKKYNSLVTIHAVGWEDTILALLDKVKLERFIVHGFTGSIESAREYYKRGGIISINKRIKRAKSYPSLLFSLPCFLTETDMKTGEEEIKELENWNTELSLILQRDVAQSSHSNFLKLYR